MKKETIQDICESLEAEHETPYALNLLFDDCRIDLLTDSKELCRDLESYFKAFIAKEKTRAPNMVVKAFQTAAPKINHEFTVKQPDPGKTKIKEEYIDFPDGRLVRKRLTGMMFLFGGNRNAAVGPCVQNSNQIINFINNRFMEAKLNQGYFLAHAAGVIWEGKGISMAGFSGMGKSTLALHLMSAGGTFVSNDRLLFKKNSGDYKMVGVAKLPRINPGTALSNRHLKNVIPDEEKNEFHKLSNDELWHLEQKYDVFIDECFGPDKFTLNASMDLIVMLNWNRNEKNIRSRFVDFENRKDLLRAFMKSPGLFYEPEKIIAHDYLSEENYIRQLQDIRVLEISGGVNFDQAVQTISKTLNEHFSSKATAQQ